MSLLRETLARHVPTGERIHGLIRCRCGEWIADGQFTDHQAAVLEEHRALAIIELPEFDHVDPAGTGYGPNIFASIEGTVRCGDRDYSPEHAERIAGQWVAGSRAAFEYKRAVPREDPDR
jgi:hypothetical protein